MNLRENSFLKCIIGYQYHRQVAQLPWISPTYFLAIHSYYPSLPAGLLDYILCPCKTVVCEFFSVSQHWPIRVLDSMGERPL